MALPHTLPDGRRGQALAVALAILAAVMLWISTAMPLIGWYESRAAELSQQQVLAVRMKVLSTEIPALRRAVSAAGLQTDDDQALLTGKTDAIAGANLQSALQILASQAGTNIDSAELLPAQQSGALRRISMQVSVTSSWPVLVALLQAIGTAHPYMIVGQISLSNSLQMVPDGLRPLQANFTVIGFRAAAP